MPWIVEMWQGEYYWTIGLSLVGVWALFALIYWVLPNSSTDDMTEER